MILLVYTRTVNTYYNEEFIAPPTLCGQIIFIYSFNIYSLFTHDVLALFYVSVMCLTMAPQLKRKENYASIP